jgi:hypothetical protein
MSNPLVVAKTGSPHQKKAQALNVELIPGWHILFVSKFGHY